MKSKEVGRGVPRRKLFHLSSRAQVVTRAPLPLMNSGNAVPMAHGKESLFQGRLKWPLSLGRYGHGKSTGVDGQGTRQFVSQKERKKERHKERQTERDLLSFKS